MAAFRRDALHGAALPCTAIHRDDPMLRFFVGQRQGHREAALVDYFATGLQAARVVEGALRWRFGDPLERLRVLDFASGYGRVSRFLVQRLSARRIWVSDILPGAVEFQRTHLGVHAFLSADDPTRLACEESFDAVTVASLFSHLPPALFVPWLRRLWSLVRPGGLLLFSVHDAALQPRLRGHVPGTRFDACSEIAELSLDHYGTSWVEEPFVRDAVREATGADCLRVPRGLWSFQDVYVVCRGEAPPFAPRWSRATGFVERAERSAEGDLLRVDGWLHDPDGTEDGGAAGAARVEVRLDGELLAELPADGPRDDVAAFLGAPGVTAAGWSGEIARAGGFAGESILTICGRSAGRETLLHLGTLESAELALRQANELSHLRRELDRVHRSRFWKLREAWWSLRGRLRSDRASGGAQVRVLIALLLLLWCGLGFAREATRAARGWRDRRQMAQASSFFWRFGAPPVQRLRRCMDEARRVVPAGSLVAIADPADDFFRWRWSAYFLAADDVITMRHPEAASAAYAIALGRGAALAGERLAVRRDCAVYRLR